MHNQIVSLSVPTDSFAPDVARGSQEKFMYRVGFPFWKTAARIGIPVKVTVNVRRDEASGTYWAESDDLDGLVVSGATLDELQREVLSAASTLLDLSMTAPRVPVTADMHLRSPVPCPA